MTTAETVAERALDEARTGEDPDRAIADLLDTAGERRVAIVRARQLLEERPEATDEATARAVALLDEALARIPI